jgi:hypothetical protein
MGPNAGGVAGSQHSCAHRSQITGDPTPYLIYDLLLSFDFGVVLYVKRIVFFRTFSPLLYFHFVYKHFLFFSSRDEKRGGKEAAAPPLSSVTAQPAPLPGLSLSSSPPSSSGLRMCIILMRIRIQLFN